jgi:hypothetical protein
VSEKRSTNPPCDLSHAQADQNGQARSFNQVRAFSEGLVRATSLIGNACLNATGQFRL